MASGTILGIESGQSQSGTFFQTKIEWSESNQTTSGVPPLTSKVTARLYAKKGSRVQTLYLTTNGDWQWSFGVAGDVTSGATYAEILTDWVLLATKEVTVTHNAQTGAATARLYAVVNAPTGTSLAGLSSEADSTVNLDTLYVRPSYSPSSISANKSTVAMGDSVTFTITNESASLTHDIVYTYGNQTTLIRSGVGTGQYTWSVPNLLERGVSGVCTVKCSTFDNGTLVGYRQTTVNITPYPTSTLTINKSNVKVGESVTLTVTSNSNYVNVLLFSLNGASDNTITSISGSGSYTYTVPASIVQYMVGSDVLTLKVATFYGSTQIGSNSQNCGLTVDTPTIPSMPDTVNLGESVSIRLPRLSPYMTHEVWFVLEEETVTISQSAGESLTWTPSYDLAKLIRSYTIGYGVMYVKTMLGGQQVGTTQTKNITVNVPYNDVTKPSITMTIERIQPQGLDQSLQGFWLQQISKIKATFSSSSEYSSIPTSPSPYEFTNGIFRYGNVSNPFVKEVEQSNSVVLTGTVTDARGYSNSVSETINAVAYFQPMVLPYSGANDILCERCISDGTYDDEGTYLHIKANATVAPINVDGHDYNSYVFQYRYKESTESWGGDETGWTQLSPSAPADVILPNIVTDTTKGYTVQIRVKDLVGYKHVVTMYVPANITPLHLAEGGTGLGLGMMNGADGIDVGWEMRFHTGIGKFAVFHSDSVGWQVGHFVTDDFPSGDDSKVSQYTMFLAEVEDLSTRFFIPVYRCGDYFYGSTTLMNRTFSIKCASFNTLGLSLDYAIYTDAGSSTVHNMSDSGYKIISLYQVM